MSTPETKTSDDGDYNIPDDDGLDITYDPRTKTKMEVVATAEEVRAYCGRNPRPYYVFAEDRAHSIRRKDALPKHWLTTDESSERFMGTAQPGEFYVLQLGVYAHDVEVTDLSLTFTELTGDVTIPQAAITCLNMSGLDFKGNPFIKKVSVVKGCVQPLWIGISVPTTAQGVVTGEITVTTNGQPDTSVPVTLEISGDTLLDQGDSDSWRLSRLRWLNSDRGLDDIVVKPFTPIVRDGRTLSFLGRTITINSFGLPDSIVSTFTAANTAVDGEPIPVLADPIRFVIETSEGYVTLVPGPLIFTAEGKSAIRWQATAQSSELTMIVDGLLELDGFVEFTCRIKAERVVEILDVRLETVYEKSAAIYFMGLDRTGGYRPETLDWRWDTNKNQDGWWMGAVNAGMKLRLKGDNFRSPLINAYYHFRELNLPESWGNDGRGGVHLRSMDETVVMTAFSGARRLNAGDDVGFHFDLSLTPFKPLATENHWRHRYFHPNQKVDDPDLRDLKRVKAMGANVVNVHHNKEQNPTINYPYFDKSLPLLKQCVDDAHENGLKLKIYYTTREITNNLPELFAFHSLNGEVICPGAGPDSKPTTNKKGPHPWLTAHLRDAFIPAWREVLGGRYEGLLDLAVITTPDSRLDNFYMEGLAYVIEQAGIDGLYIDDTTLGRKCFQRIRRIFEATKGECQIDMHSWNHFNALSGYTQSAYYFMDNFPYYDKIWFGEGFTRNYDTSSEEFWLVEVSGIPFGQLGEMMYRGMPIRGMLYGMTSRLGWNGANPQPMWGAMDAFGMAGSEMIGYWDPNCPVATDRDTVKATVYRKAGKSMIVVAGWNVEEETVTLTIDWEQLGLDPEKVTLHAPEIESSQSEARFSPTDVIPITPSKGWVFILE